MIVKYSRSKFRVAREQMSEEQFSAAELADSDLEDSSKYVVFAIYFDFSSNLNRPGYILSPPNGTGPMIYYSGFFDEVDPRLSKFWILHSANKTISEKPNDSGPRLAFPEWGDGFLNKLVDFGTRSSAYETFSSYSDKISREYPRPDIRSDLVQLEDGWVMCPDCTDSWETDKFFGITYCSGCSTAFNNPFWSATDPLNASGRGDSPD